MLLLADARPAAELARASLAVVLADARPAAELALASYSVVLADARGCKQCGGSGIFEHNRERSKCKAAG